MKQAGNDDEITFAAFLDSPTPLPMLWSQQATIKEAMALCADPCSSYQPGDVSRSRVLAFELVFTGVL
jgi:hypothetical protein